MNRFSFYQVDLTVLELDSAWWVLLKLQLGKQEYLD